MFFFDVLCLLFGDKVEYFIEELSDDFLFRFVVVVIIVFVYDFVFCLCVLSFDCFCIVGFIIFCLGGIFIFLCDMFFVVLRFNNFCGKVGVSFDLSVLFKDVF